MLCSGAGAGKMYCSKSTGLQDFRAEPTWSYPGSTSPSFPMQMSLRLSSPAWQHSLYTSPHPEPTFWEPALQDLLLHTSYLIFQWVPPHLSWRLLPASQLPFCGVGLIERAVEESSPARSQTRCYFWFFSSFFFSPTLRNYSYSNRLPPTAWGMENNFFSLRSRWNGVVWRSCYQRDNGPWVTAQALGMGLVCRAVGQQRY